MDGTNESLFSIRCPYFIIFILMIRLKEILLEGMTVDIANTIFSKFGIPAASSLDKKELKNYYVALVKRHHPDVGGNDENMRWINAAYDVLKDATPSQINFHTDATPDVPPNRTYPKDPKTKHMYTIKFTVQFRSALNGRMLYEGQCDQIDFIAILRKLKMAGVYMEVEGNIVYVDASKFAQILPEIRQFFTT